MVEYNLRRQQQTDHHMVDTMLDPMEQTNQHCDCPKTSQQESAVYELTSIMTLRNDDLLDDVEP